LLVKIFRRLSSVWLGSVGIPKHPALFHRHDVEGGPNDAVIPAEGIGFRDRKALFSKRIDHAVFAIDRMCGGPHFAEWFSAHHVGTAGRVKPVGRVGLAALELQNDQRPLITFDVFAHPCVEPRLVETLPLLDRPGA
jgi:hypothetical protein